MHSTPHITVRMLAAYGPAMLMRARVGKPKPRERVRMDEN